MTPTRVCVYSDKSVTNPGIDIISMVVYIYRCVYLVRMCVRAHCTWYTFIVYLYYLHQAHIWICTYHLLDNYYYIVQICLKPLNHIISIQPFAHKIRRINMGGKIKREIMRSSCTTHVYCTHHYSCMAKTITKYFYEDNNQ